MSMYREKNSKTDSLKLLGHTAVERFCLCHVHVCLYNTYKYLLQNAILYYSYLYVCNNIEFCQRWYVVDSVFLGAFPDHVTYKVCRIMQISGPLIKATEILPVYQLWELHLYLHTVNLLKLIKLSSNRIWWNCILYVK